MSTANEARSPAPGYRRSGSERAYLLAVSLPPLLLLSVLAYGRALENRAESDSATNLAQIQQDGYPIDNHTMTQWFDRRTSNKNSAQWQEAFVATRGLERRFELLITNRVVDFDRLVAPDQQWKAGPIAARYAEEAKPILDLVENLIADAELVWQPLLMDGHKTQLVDLQATRGITQLLTNEFRVAVHQGDQHRAMRALELMCGVSDAFDWRIGFISDFVYYVHYDEYRSLIRQSLELGFWTDLQLIEQLKQRLSKPDLLEQRWQQSIATEQAMILAELSRANDSTLRVGNVNLFPFGVPPTSKARLVETMSEIASVKDAGTREHVRQADETMNRRNGESGSSITITGIPFATAETAIALFQPAFTHAADRFARIARDRRWTLTAVGIKLFQQQQQRWPSSLDELTAVGLSPSDWMATDSSAFGYQISDDGREAILWSLPPAGTAYAQEIMQRPPSVFELDRATLQQMEVRIPK